MESLLDTNQAAAFTGNKSQTLEKWRVTGIGPKFIKVGRSVRYDPKDLRDWIEAHKRTSTSQQSAG